VAHLTHYIAGETLIVCTTDIDMCYTLYNANASCRLNSHISCTFGTTCLSFH